MRKKFTLTRKIIDWCTYVYLPVLANNIFREYNLFARSLVRSFVITLKPYMFFFLQSHDMNSEYIGNENIELFDFGYNVMEIEHFVITAKAINKALYKCGYRTFPEHELDQLSYEISTKFTSVNEVCMFISVIFYRTKGLRIFAEPLPPSNSHVLGDIYRDTNTHAPNFVFYYGRGHILLKYSRNYAALSEALGYGMGLINHPDIILNDPRTSIVAAITFWVIVLGKQFDCKKCTYTEAISKIWITLEKCKPKTADLQAMYTIYFRTATLFEVKTIYFEHQYTPKKNLPKKMAEAAKRVFYALKRIAIGRY